MSNLEIFLVEEGYCDTEREAIKILECISDEFYYFLIEKEISAKDATTQARQRLKSAFTKVGKPNFNPKEIQHYTKKIKALEPFVGIELAQSRESGSKSLQQTPRGVGGSRAQTTDIATTTTSVQKSKQRGRPMMGASLNVPSVAAAAERETSRQTRTSAEVGRAGGASRQRTGVVRTGKYTQMQSGGGATTPVPNKGTSRTGAQFPRQQG